jgi:hypothetical protein
MKVLVWLLMGFGFLFFLLGWAVAIYNGNPLLLLIGLGMIAGGLFMGLHPSGILRKERAIDNWSVLLDEACIENGDTQTPDKFYNDISTFLDASEAPNLKVERQYLVLRPKIWTQNSRF